MSIFATNKEPMKKIVYIFLFAFILTALASCGSKKKGCGMTADAASQAQQEIVVDQAE